MNHLVRFRHWLALSLFFGLCLLTTSVLAQNKGAYDLSWMTVNSGGSTSSGGGYTLSSSIGQPEAGVIQGSGYTITGGFWHAPHVTPPGNTPQPIFRVYLPFVR